MVGVAILKSEGDDDDDNDKQVWRWSKPAYSENCDTKRDTFYVH